MSLTEAAVDDLAHGLVHVATSTASLFGAPAPTIVGRVRVDQSLSALRQMSNDLVLGR